MSAERPGYIKLWRKVLDNGASSDMRITHTFVHILLRCAWKPRTDVVRGKLVHVKPGELVFVLRTFAAELNMSIHDLRTALKLLSELEVVSIKSTHEFSVITLRKWAHYQATGSEPTHAQHTLNTRSTHGSGKGVVAEGEKGPEEGKKERTILDPIKIKRKRDPYLLKHDLKKYYEVFDPRHPGWSNKRDNEALQKKWEEKHGKPWIAPPDYQEEASA